MSGFSWFKQDSNEWIYSTDIQVLEPLAEYALMRLRLHMWNTPECMLPDNDAVLMRLSRLEEYRGMEGPISDDYLNKCLASVKQMLSKCSANGKHLLFDDALLAQKKHLKQVSESRAAAGRAGKNVKKTRVRREKQMLSKCKTNAEQSISISISNSDLNKEGECEGELPKFCPPLPASLDTPKGRQLLRDWDEFKRKRGEAYRSSHGWASLLKTFESLGVDALEKAMRTSFDSNYAGIFPPRAVAVSNNVTHRQTALERGRASLIRAIQGGSND